MIIKHVSYCFGHAPNVKFRFNNIIELHVYSEKIKTRHDGLYYRRSEFSFITRSMSDDENYKDKLIRRLVNIYIERE